MKRDQRRAGRILRRRALLGFDPMESRTLLSGLTVTVTTTAPLGSNGAVSLADAINLTNANPATAADPNVIRFALPGNGPQTISLTSALPIVAQPTRIAGYTQAGSSINTNPATQADNAVLMVAVSGGRAIGTGIDFGPGSAGSRVEGLALGGFTNTAILIEADKVSVGGNFLGVAPGGQPSAGTLNRVGVEVLGVAGASIGGVATSMGSIGGTVGGTFDANRNVIAGSTLAGVYLDRGGAITSSNASILGNFIGTNADQTPVAGAGFRNSNGVVASHAAGLTIGGTATGAGNLVSGSANYGVEVAVSTGVVVAGDVIQANGSFGIFLDGSSGSSLSSLVVGGSGSLGNGSTGIFVLQSANVTIGGTFVLGNAGTGIDLLGSANAFLSADTIVSNKGAGVLLGESQGATLTALTVGGAGSLGNGGDGVSFDTGSGGGSLSSSTLFGNAGFGISAVGISGSTVGGYSLIGDVIRSNAAGGVRIVDAQGSSLTNSVIGGAGNLGNGAFGVSVSGSGNVTLGGAAGAGLSITGNHGPGVEFQATSFGASILGSTIFDNAGDGLDLFDSMNAVIAGNVIQANAGRGVLLSGSGFAFLGGFTHGVGGDTIGGTAAGQGNSLAGVAVVNSPNVTLSEVQVAGNGGDGIDFDAASANGLVVGSSSNGNAGYGVAFVGSTASSLNADTIQSNAMGGVRVVDAPIFRAIASTIGGQASGQGNGGYGISVVGSPGALIGENRLPVSVEGNAAGGILLSGGSDNSLILETTANLNAGVGIAVQGSAGVSITGSTVSSNLSGGVLFSNAARGVVNSVKLGGLAYVSTIDRNSGYGVSVVGSANVTIGGIVPGDGITIAANRGVGLSIGGLFGGGSNNSYVAGSSIVNNQGDGIDVFGSTGGTIGGTSLVSNAGGGLLLSGQSQASVAGNNIQLNGSFGVSSVNSALQLSGSILNANNGVGVSIVGEYPPPPAPVAVIFPIVSSLSGDTIQRNLGGGLLLSNATGTSVASSTIGGTLAGGSDRGNGGFGVSIGGSVGVTIGDPSGFGTLVASNQGVGISATDSLNLKINGVIVESNQGVGVTVAASPNFVVTDAIIRANQGGGLAILDNSFETGQITASTIGGTTSAAGNGVFGLSVDNSTGVAIGSVFAPSPILVQYNKGPGIEVALSSGVSISGTSYVANNGGGGVVVTSSPGFSILGSTILENGGAGVLFGPGSDSSTLFNDYIHDNDGAGVAATLSTSLVLGRAAEAGGVGLPPALAIVGNRGPGIALSGGLGARIIGALVRSNRGGGILLDGLMRDGKVAATTVGGTASQGNGLVGIGVSNSPGLLLTGLSVDSNGGDGIVVASSPGASVVRTSAGGNLGAGIKVVGGSNGTSLAADLVGGNAGPGVFVSGSSYVTVGGVAGLGVAAFGNSGDGIDLNASPMAIVLGVEVGGNFGAGISAINSAGASIGDPSAAAYVHDNGGDGIVLAGLGGSSLANATILDNLKNGLVVTAPDVAISATRSLGNVGSGVVVAGLGNAITQTLGLVSSGNHGYGVFLLESGGNNIAGAFGTTVEIAANGQGGVEILGVLASGNRIGSALIDANVGDGVALDGGATYNAIVANVITRNAGSGVRIADGSNLNTVALNLIGTNPAGGFAGNAGAGVAIVGASSNVVGPGNIIAFNGGKSVAVDPADVASNLVASNSTRGNLGDA